MPNIAYLDLKYDRRSTVTTLYDDPFTITALTNNCTINISNISDDTDITFKYSIDNGMSYEDVTIEAGDTFSFTISTAGYSVPLVKTESGHWMSNIRIDSDEGDEFSVSGNIMTLMDASQNITSVPGYYFYGLFNGADGLVDASELRLPATEVGQSSYANMFDGCSNLKKGPAILPATTLDEYCYGYMFGGCSSLIAAPSLPATTLAEGCYNMMFWSCDSLMISPELPSTTLAYYCYHGMFGYSGLSAAPVLPATTLADNCYEEMFIGCGALVTAPALPATTLADYCYKSMFEGCVSLTAAPNLIAENMVKECYKRMFYNCENLNFIRILAKDTANNYITDWVHHVAPIGIFIKDPDKTYTINSDSGVPIGWTVANEGEDIPNYYYVTLDMEDPELQATLIGAGRYVAGTTVTISVTDVQDYGFDGWLSGDTIVSYNQTWSFEIHENVSLKAVFKPISAFSNDYFTIKPLENGAEFYILGEYTHNSYTIDIKVNSENWHTYSFRDLELVAQFYGSSGNLIKQMYRIRENESELILNEGDTIQFRRFSASDVYSSYISFGCTKLYNVSGNIACLDPRHDDTFISDDVYIGKDLDIMYQHEKYSGLFDYNPHMPPPGVHDGDIIIIEPKNNVKDARYLILPATTLNNSCYSNMFFGCESLTTAPVLSATTLAPHCYEAMFRGCYRLTTAPELPATTLADNCYEEMFMYCWALVTAPTLPATTLAPHCYEAMFYGCTLLTTTPVLSATTLADNCYEAMFRGCYRLTTAPELPATTLAPHCYEAMFYGCTLLTTAPVLSATTLANYCYSNMFYGCSSLTTTPELPATTLAPGCYLGMFYGCRLLTTAPELPATTLALGCYSNMFSYCISLTTAPVLPATTLAQDCYTSMFSYCISLTTAPVLPATTLEHHCYASMFSGCLSLTKAPTLPATTLAPHCYDEMFKNCTSLTTAPVLPATTLTFRCYVSMFEGCTLLTKAPTLHATYIDMYSYEAMFKGCTSLNYVKCLATDFSIRDCTRGWLEGVSSTGTFVKAASMNYWSRGNNGIPWGWTVQDYVE